MTANPTATIVYLEAAINGVLVREEPAEILTLAAAPGDVGRGGVQLIKLTAFDDGTDVLVAPTRIACVLKATLPSPRLTTMHRSERLQ